MLRRLLQPACEARLGAAGGAELRRDLLGRLAASQPVGGSFHELVLCPSPEAKPEPGPEH